MFLERLKSNFKKELYAAYISITPSTYFKLSIGIAFGLTIIINFIFNFLPFKFMFIEYKLIPHGILLSIIIFIGTIIFMAYLPKILLQFRKSDLDAELPFFLIYLSTLSIIMPPLQVFERVTRAPDYIFRETRKEGRRLQIETKIYGRDPISVVEEIARMSPHKYFRSVLEGYATAVKSGSNPVEYLVKQAEVYLKKAAGEIKARAEALSSLMEALVSVFTFTTITLFSLSISNEALPSLAGQIVILRVPREMTMVTYVMPLLLAILFLLMAKSLQPRKLISEYRQYFIIGPLLLISIIASIHLILNPIKNSPLSFLRKLIEFIPVKEYMFKPMLISIILISTSTISALIDYKWSRYYSSLKDGLRQFVKDLAELRRTGLSPEACISQLANRNYGVFTRLVKLLDEYLKTLGNLKNYLNEVLKMARDWITIALIYILIESLEVGGGKPEIFDRFASYTDSLFIIEAEKKSRLKILKVLPFATAIIQFFAISAVMFIFDFMIMSLRKTSLTMRIGPIIFSILILTNFIYGLVAGLISEERFSAGFKYSAILTGISILMLILGEGFIKNMMGIIGGIPSAR